MTSIKTSCTHCGDITVSKSIVELRIDPQNTDASLYGFECPDCHEVVVRRASARIVRLLVSCGIKTRFIDTIAPQATLERTDADYDTFTLDDVLSFHETLTNDDWMSHVLGKTN